MAKGINKAIIIGNLGDDPEVRYMPNGDAVANLSVATSESWKDQQGKPQERTEWHKVTMYRKLAEIAGQYLRKGAQVYIEGKMQTRKWQDQQGNDRYTTEVIADKLQMLGGGNSSNQDKPSRAPQGGQQPQNTSGYNQQQPDPRQSQRKAPMQEPDFNYDDDIPF